MKRTRDHDANSNTCDDLLLYQASQLGDVPNVMRLLEKGANHNFKTKRCRITPLHVASRFGHRTVASLLIGRGATVNAQDSYGETPLLSACDTHHWDVCALLLENGADVRSISSTGETPLHLASRPGNLPISKMLIERGANVNAIDNDGQVPLLSACQANNYHLCRFLIDNGAYVQPPLAGSLPTPLHIASEMDNTEISKLLMERGANPNAKTKWGSTPLHWAIRHRSHTAAKLLAENRATDIHAADCDGETPLYKACLRHSLGVAKILIENGADLLAREKNGRTLLHAACITDHAGLFEHLDILALLLEKGANPNIQDSNGMTPLHYSIKFKSEGTPKLLLQSGADPNMEDNQGMVPLRNAVEEDQLDTVKFLLENGAHPSIGIIPTIPLDLDLHILRVAPDLITNVPSKLKLNLQRVRSLLQIMDCNYTDNADISYACTPLHWACVWQHSELLELLLQKGADIHAKDSYGMSPLHWPSYLGLPDIVTSLLKKGAKTNAQSKKGYSPLHLACSQNNVEVTWLLVRQDPFLMQGHG